MTRITADECSPEAARSRPMFCRVISLGCVDMKAYVAGPPAMIRAATGILSYLAIERANFYTHLSPVAVSSGSERPRSLATRRQAIDPAAASVSSRA